VCLLEVAEEVPHGGAADGAARPLALATTVAHRAQVRATAAETLKKYPAPIKKKPKGGGAKKAKQKEYADLMADAQATRASDSKALSDKMSAKAETDAALEKHTDEKAATTEE